MTDPVTTGWIIPAATEVWDHREEVISVWKQILTALDSRKAELAITGMEGVGKSVLADFLSGRAYAMGYEPPDFSFVEETNRMATEKAKVALRVVPGHASPQRNDSLEELFEAKRPVCGVIHVVANGFARLREEATKDTWLRDLKVTNVDAYRKQQLARELADLNETCAAIRKSHRKHRAPTFLIVAVSQVDLWEADLTQVRAYYAPKGPSEFSKRLDLLQSEVGSDNLFWQPLPVCTSLEPFSWDGHQVSPTLSSRQRDVLVGRLCRTLKALVSSEKKKKKSRGR